MKKLTTVTLGLLLTLILTGCNQPTTQTNTPEPLPENTPNFELTFEEDAENNETETTEEANNAETEKTTDDESSEAEEVTETTDESEEEADTTTLNVNTTDSKVAWSGAKIIGGSHEGFINLQSGSITMMGEYITAGEFVIDMNTMVCTDLEGSSADKLIAHFEADDYFDVANHPTATFAITGTQKTDTGYEITGDMTIKGITHSITFPATVTETSAKADISLDRTKWGIGGALLKDEIQIGLELVLE